MGILWSLCVHGIAFVSQLYENIDMALTAVEKSQAETSPKKKKKRKEKAYELKGTSLFCSNGEKRKLRNADG